MAGSTNGQSFVPSNGTCQPSMIVGFSSAAARPSISPAPQCPVVGENKRHKEGRRVFYKLLCTTYLYEVHWWTRLDRPCHSNPDTYDVLCPLILLAIIHPTVVVLSVIAVRQSITQRTTLFFLFCFYPLRIFVLSTLFTPYTASYLSLPLLSHVQAYSRPSFLCLADHDLPGNMGTGTWFAWVSPSRISPHWGYKTREANGTNGTKKKEEEKRGKVTMAE